MSPFIAKLRILLQQRKYFNAIHWSPDGRSLVISDIDTFKDQVLETDDEMFKTKNFASFVRQLNLYGFKKIQTTNMKGDPTIDMHFEHPNFRKDRPDLVSQVHRTCNSTKRRSLVGHFQDVYTPKRLRLGSEDCLPMVSPLGERQNGSHGQTEEKTHKRSLFELDNEGTALKSLSDCGGGIAAHYNQSRKAVQSQEHDYALPMFEPLANDEYDENKMYEYLRNHFQDEITVVQALLSMASQNKTTSRR